MIPTTSQVEKPALRALPEKRTERKNYLRTRRWVMGLSRFVFKRLAKVEMRGTENIPPDGAFLLTTNHMSRLDTPFLLLGTEREDVVAVVATNYQSVPLIKWFLDRTGAVWLDRDATDFAAIRDAIDYLKRGWIVGLAPEGTRSKVHALIEGKPGSAVLAERANAPILPVGITGTENLLSCWKKFKRPSITITFGKPYYLTKCDVGDRENWLVESTDEIMCRIGAILPESYRGFYKDHPRLKQLLEQAE